MEVETTSVTLELGCEKISVVAADVTSRYIISEGSEVLRLGFSPLFFHCLF